jgi:RHS repeat-associated protein
VTTKQWVFGAGYRPLAELDGSGSLVARFVYVSSASVPDYVLRGGVTYRIISDHLGSPRHAVNVANSADVPFTANYSVFGDMSGSGLDWLPFGFAGGMADPDTGLVRFGARDYDPMVGRWTAKDPSLFVGGANLYAYALNDPVNFVDPFGRWPMSEQHLRELIVNALEDLSDMMGDLSCKWDPVGCAKRVKAENADIPHIQDKFAHCVNSCEIAMQCGTFTAQGAGFYKEAQDIRDPERHAEMRDLVSNVSGRFCADIVEENPEKNCRECCINTGYGPNDQ